MVITPLGTGRVPTAVMLSYGITHAVWRAVCALMMINSSEMSVCDWL